MQKCTDRILHKEDSLPKEIRVYTYENDNYSSVSKMKFDKYDNLKSVLVSEMIPVKFTTKYKKKDVISSVSYTDSEVTVKKSYDKKGRIKKVKAAGSTFKYKMDKKNMIKKVTFNGDKSYSVKKIKYHKNGFASKVVYGNGNVDKYNSDGLLTSAKVKGGPKYTYKYTKKNGKVVKAIVKKNGKKYQKVEIEYGKDTTKNVWKYSCVFSYGGALSYAGELYSEATLSGFNQVGW